MVNVKDFGAIGNGTTDDTMALQSALNKAYLGGEVFFPIGTYKITKELRYYSHQHLRFEKGARLLRGSSAVTTLLINDNSSRTKAYEAIQNVIIEGAIFDGNADITTNISLLCIGHGQNVTVRDCTFEHVRGTWHCIEINACNDVIVEDCLFWKPMITGENGEYIQFDAMLAYAHYPWKPCYFDGTVSKNIIIRNNIFKGNPYSPAIGNHADAMHDTILIYENTFYAFKSSRATIDVVPSCKNVIIKDNNFRDCTNGVNGSSDTIVYNNTFRGCVSMGENHKAQSNWWSGTFKP